VNILEKWLMRRIIMREVKQGYCHKLRVRMMYAQIREACEAEFTEDNAPTLDAFLLELFESTQYSHSEETK